jgi:hypothetical protein|tara:strand:+ start:275 stop:649 length:375 start_codon:yes stop_codon:yes gene_type:complete
MEPFSIRDRPPTWYKKALYRCTCCQGLIHGFDLTEKDVPLDEIKVGDGTIYDWEWKDSDPYKQWHLDKVARLLPDIDKNGMNKPIRIYKDEDNTFYDGIHRLMVHRILGKKTIRCVTMEVEWKR